MADIDPYSGGRYQRGYGILQDVMRVAIPLTKKLGTKKVLSEGYKTGSRLVGDLLRGKDMKKAAKKRLFQAAINTLQGPAPKRRRRKKQKRRNGRGNGQKRASNGAGRSAGQGAQYADIFS